MFSYCAHGVLVCLSFWMVSRRSCFPWCFMVRLVGATHVFCRSPGASFCDSKISDFHTCVKLIQATAHSRMKSIHQEKTSVGAVMLWSRIHQQSSEPRSRILNTCQPVQEHLAYFWEAGRRWVSIHVSRNDVII